MRFGLTESPFDLSDTIVGLFLDGVQIKHFDGDFIFSLVVHSEVDGSEGSSSELIVDYIFVNSSVGDGSSAVEVVLVVEVEVVHL